MQKVKKLTEEELAEAKKKRQRKRLGVIGHVTDTKEPAQILRLENLAQARFGPSRRASRGRKGIRTGYDRTHDTF